MKIFVRYVAITLKLKVKIGLMKKSALIVDIGGILTVLTVQNVDFS
jgi:hypothetical protein